MRNFEESVVYWQAWGKKIPDGSFFPRTSSKGRDPVITEARLLFAERHTSPSICLTAGSVLPGLSIDVQEQYAGRALGNIG